MNHRLRDAGAALGIAFSPLQTDRLIAYLALLQRWNKVYNLTALRDPDAMFSHHLVDCLAALPALRRHAAGQPLRVLDVGSGGGLPGVVLAVMQPDWEVVCVDAVGKKAGFIAQVAAELTLPNLRALHARIESLPASAGWFELIVSRAFASLADFAALSQAALADGGVWAAMKARPTAAELAGLPPGIEVFHVEQLAVPGLDAQRCLVWMRRRAQA